MHLAVIPQDLSQLIRTHPEDHAAGAAVPVHDESDGHTHSSAVPSLVNTALAHGDEEDGDALAAEDHLAFTVPFTKPGLYKVFGQFRPKDAGLSPEQYLLAQFWVQVSDQPAAVIAPVAPANKWAIWWRNLIVSLLLIALLCWIVKKYVTVK